MDALIGGLLESGAPWGVLCGVLALAVVTLWRRNLALTDRVYELATTHIQIHAETRSTLDTTNRELDRMSQRFAAMPPTVQPPRAPR